MTDQKIIFLDFDGVCTSMVETPGSYLNHPISEYGPSPDCMRQLKELCKQTDAKIIVTSNWRNYGFKKYVEYHGKKILNPLIALYQQIGKRITEMLPPTGIKKKLKAVIHWLEETQFSGKFIIIDDDLEEGFQNEIAYGISDKFVKTKTEIGLTEREVKKAIELLK